MRIAFAVDEPVSEPPGLTVGGAAVEHDAGEAGDSFFELVIEDRDRAGRLEVVASVSDVAGNVASLSLGHIRYDGDAPDAPRGAIRIATAHGPCSRTSAPDPPS